MSDRSNGSPNLVRGHDRSRPLDLVLFGASSFVGQITAEYLVRHAETAGLRWALGGRNREKLEAVRSELAAIVPSAAELPLRVGDSHDTAFLSRLATEASVICSTVGPYARYGSELVSACAEHGTDYADLTGETQWIRRMIDRHHARAEETGARIVTCCGFDSIPSDIGTFMLQEHALASYGSPCTEVKLCVGKMRGSASGGTVASMLNIVDEVKKDRSVVRLLGHPYSLNPEGQRSGLDGSDQRGVRYDRDFGQWTAPFVMSNVNMRVVRRSNALLAHAYGEGFCYSEAMGFPPGLKGALAAGGFTLGMGALFGGMALGPTRKLIERRLPAPGEGPSREERERGFFHMHLLGKGESESGPFQVRAHVEGMNDPGYGETGKMLGESALCLALQGQELQTAGGILTPASCMGSALLARLRAAGMKFEIEAG